jgi:hypothetical protein
MIQNLRHWFGTLRINYEVWPWNSRMILFHSLRAMQFGHSKEVSMHVFNLHQLQFQCVNTICVEVVALVRYDQH